jgi:hypothetical protein
MACASDSLCFATDEALVIGIPARELSVSLSGDGTVTSAKAVCPFGCTYSGPACPRACGGRPLTGYIPARIEGISCIESALFVAGNWGTCSASLPAQDTITLTATPAERLDVHGLGRRLQRDRRMHIAMDAERFVSARFAATPTPTLTKTVPQAPVLTQVAQTHAYWRTKAAHSHCGVGDGTSPSALCSPSTSTSRRA